MKVSIAMTNNEKKCSTKTPFLTKTVQNAPNHSKLAAKRPKCTKTENRSETL